MPTTHDADRAERWREVLREQNESGLSISAFCRLRRHSTASFYYWKRALKKEVAAGRARPAVRPRRPNSPSAFLPVQVTSTAPAEIEIQLPDGTLVRVASGCDGDLLAPVLHVLEKRTC